MTDTNSRAGGPRPDEWFTVGAVRQVERLRAVRT